MLTDLNKSDSLSRLDSTMTGSVGKVSKIFSSDNIFVTLGSVLLEVGAVPVPEEDVVVVVTAAGVEEEEVGLKTRLCQWPAVPLIVLSVVSG